MNLHWPKKLERLRPHGQIKYPQWLNLLFAFLIPFLGMVILMIIGGYEPFGDGKTMLYSDCYHQYYPFFVTFRKNLLSGESLLYSWDVGIGMDYLGLISYYLASPLNLLSVLVPESLTLEYFSMLMPIKLGLAGLFFAIFLKKTFNVHDISIAIFGGFYAMCAWALGYQWKIMWLDTFALLPLVALGAVSLLRDKKFILYTVSLFFSIFANYYIGLFTCIFVFLIFVCYEICRFQDIRKLAADFLRIALFSVLAIGMTAILELPALAALQNTYSSVNQYPEGFALNIVEEEKCAAAVAAWEAFKTCDAGFLSKIGLWFKAIFSSFSPLLEGMRQIAGNMGGALSPTFKEGLPNIYCGVGTIILAILFLTAKEVKLRDKICSVCLLVFFMLSFLIRQLDYIWHGFHFTNMIPYRFSFLFSFVLLYMAYRAWLIRGSFKLWQLIVAGVGGLLIMLCNSDWTRTVYFLFNCGFIGMYLGVFLFIAIERILARRETSEDAETKLEALEKRRTRQGGILLCLILALELVLNLVSFGVKFTYTDITNSHFGSGDTVPITNYLDERAEYQDFFRTEVTHTETLNDGAVNGYYGISTFTSSANVRVTEFMRLLGYGAKNNYNRYSYEEASPVSNLFLNLKYLIERDGNDLDDPIFDKLWGTDGVYLKENKAYLPLGFLAESALETSYDDLNFSNSTSYFSKQNNLFKLATGLDENIWSAWPLTKAEVTGINAEVYYVDRDSWPRYSTGDTKGTVNLEFKVPSDGYLCLRFDLGDRNTIQIRKNGAVVYSENIKLPQMLAVGHVEAGDTIKVEVFCDSNSGSFICVTPGIMNEELFWEGYETLAASTLDLTEFSTTRVEGTIDCNRDGLLYTSIPYDGNWIAEVDGQEAEIVLVGDAMCALRLTEGTHTITFRYRNKAFELGAVISAVCLIIFLLLIFLPKYLYRRRGKYQKP